MVGRDGRAPAEASATHVIYANGGAVKGKSPASASLINIAPENLLIVVARPSDSGKGIVLQVRETEGKTAALSKSELLRTNRFSDALVVNVLEEDTTENADQIIFKPFETKFILLN